MTASIKLLIDARLFDNQYGGTRTYVEGLAKVLHAQTIEEIRLTWLVLPFTKWWRTYLTSNDNYVTDWGFLHIAARILRVFFSDKLLLSVLNTIKKKQVLDRQLFKVRGVNMNDFDLIHFPIQDAFETNLPFIYHPHDLQHFHYPNNFSPEVIKHRNTSWKSFAEQSTKIVCASESVRQDLIKFWNIDFKKIEIIHMPSSKQQDKKTSKSFPLNHTILCIGNFWPHKNQLTLIKSIALLSKRIPDITVTFVGTGPELKNCRTMTHVLGITELINFKGNVIDSELADLYESHKIVCVPSEFEAASFPLLEAMSRNKEIVASSLPPFLELGLNSISFYGEPRNEYSLASHLEKLLTTEVNKQELELDYQKYLNSITPERIGNKFAQMYRQIADKS
jgi:glycosyltransferase involved in cell wall biosynthesis